MGGRPVTGELGGHGRRAAPDELRVPREGLGHRGVHGDPLTREQVLVHGLAEHGVAEPVRAVVDAQHLGVDRPAQRAEQGALCESGRRREEPVLGPAADHREHPEHPLDLRGERRDAHEEEVAERLGQRTLRHPLRRRHELLGQEGVSLRPLEDAVDERGTGLAPEQPGHQLGGRGAVEAVELHPAARPGPLHLGEEGPQRVPSRKLVGAERAHDPHPGPAQVPQQEGEEVAGGPVRPVEVLHHEQDGAAIAQAGQEPEEVLEEPGLASGVLGGAPRRGLGGAGRGPARGVEVGQQAPELVASAADERLELVGAQGAHEAAQRLGDG